ncbi:MAG: TerB family tellurite resistance protein [Pseudomonadota bacterium]|jgi:uncharacterized tellurite resistance protein B-like protein|nr:TerB family tellurite resistance protein [Pseudomonadota bacterium]
MTAAMVYAATMLAKVRSFFLERDGRAEATDGRHSQDELQLAAAALMVEAARLDGTFDETERVYIGSVLHQRFGLDSDQTELLIEAAAETVDSIPEIYGFTKTIRDHFSHDERIVMLQMLWEIAYADGELHDYEASLLRQVAGLLYVTDQESGIARKRARERLQI